MEQSTENSADYSSLKSRSSWLDKSWKVRPPFAISLTLGIIAFLLTLASTKSQLFALAIGVSAATFSYSALALFRTRKYPLLLCIVLSVITFLLSVATTGWYLFAAVAGLLMSAASLSVVNLYRRRAKVSLLFTACVLPMVVAIVCWGWLQLTPFRQRSMAYEVVKSSNLILSTRLSEQTGEWIVEHGRYTPSWLVKLAGEHAAKRVEALKGKLEDFQSLAVCAVSLEDLDSVWLVKDIDSPEFSTQLCDWLISCPRLNLVHLDFATISERELVLIERLSQNEAIKWLEMQLNLNHCDDHIDLGRLPRSMFVRVLADEFKVSRASEFRSMNAVTIETQAISAEAIARLTGIRRLSVVGCTFDDTSAKAISEVSAHSLMLEGCMLPDAFEVQSADSYERHVAWLYLLNTPIQSDLLTQWLSAARVKRVSLPRPSDQASEDQLTTQISAIRDLEAADFVRIINAQGERRFETVELKR